MLRGSNVRCLPAVYVGSEAFWVLSEDDVDAYWRDWFIQKSKKVITIEVLW